MSSYFPNCLRESHIRRIAEDIFVGGMEIKPRLRKGVWPHLVRVFHPGLETRAERESYLDKLRLIYDALKGRIHSREGTPLHQNRHLYDSIRRDAVRTDPLESFYRSRRNGNNLANGSTSLSTESLYLSQENISKLVNVIALYTLEHEEVSYTQGMTDLLSPILYVMEREDDAYIVFSAMAQRVSENFGTWCEGTLKKVERLRHLCEVLDPELSACLERIEDDAFALFFGMVLIECRREFSFENSFHLMEVIWSAAICMQMKEDPNWRPLSPPQARGRETSPELSSQLELDSVPSHSEWASFMSDRSPDVIRQVFGELQTYTAVPLTRSECGSLSRATLNVSLTPPSRQRRRSLLGSFHGNDTRPREEGVARRTSIDNTTISHDVVVDTHAHGHRERDVVRERDHLQSFSQTNLRERVNENERVERANRQMQVSEKKQDEENKDERERVLARPNTASSGKVSLPHSSSPNHNKSLSDPVKRKATVKSTGDSSSHGNDKVRECLVNGPSSTTEVTNGSHKAPDMSSGYETAVNSNREWVVARGNGPLRRTCSAADLSPALSPSPSPLPPPPSARQQLVMRGQTELSDLSSIGSTNGSGRASNERGLLIAGTEYEGGREDEKSVHLDDTDRSHTPPGLDPDRDFTILAAASTTDMPHQRDGVRHSVQGYTTLPRKAHTQHAEVRERDVTLLAGEMPNHTYDRGRGNTFASGKKHTNKEVAEEDEEREERDFASNTPHRPEQGQRGLIFANRDSEDTRHSTQHDRDWTLQDRSLTMDMEYPPVSPVPPFFDALETLASVSRPNSPAPPTEADTHHAPAVTALVGHLLSGEHRAAPNITREESLSVPFSDSFPLFLCLSLLVQHRGRIIHDHLDFVGLSILLNTQAGVQSLTRSLKIARRLYERYREYQRLCFGTRFSVYDVWLDNMETMFVPVTTATNQHVQNGQLRRRNSNDDEDDDQR